MILKTYGIENLVDWKAQINVGKAKVIVHFTGGAITRIGVTPAEYSTANTMMQHIIEGSDYYRSGRIKLIRAVEVADDEATKARKAREIKRSMRKLAEEATIEEETKEVGAETANGGESEANAEAEGAGAKAKEVEVSCLDDAKEYLREKFGCRNIRTWSDANKAAQERGITFVGM